MDTVGDSVRDGPPDDVLRNATLVISEDGKSTHSEAAVADTVPVALDIVRPPARASGELLLTGFETICDYRGPDLVLLIICPSLVQPVVGDGEGSGELGGVKEVSRVPFLRAGWRKVVRDCIL